MLSLIATVLFWFSIAIGLLVYLWIFVMWRRLKRQDKLDAERRHQCWVARQLIRKQDERAKT